MTTSENQPLNMFRYEGGDGNPVEAVQLTPFNMVEVADWIGGSVMVKPDDSAMVIKERDEDARNDFVAKVYEYVIKHNDSVYKVATDVFLEAYEAVLKRL